MAIFDIFSRNSPEDEMKRAKVAYEKVAELKSDSRDARSARMRMGLLCRAHLDKTFIAGAEQTADWQELAMMALSQGKPQPELPQASCYQKIKSGESDVYVYMPDEFVNDIFALGAKYQRTQITAQQAIDAVFDARIGDISGVWSARTAQRAMTPSPWRSISSWMNSWARPM